jgi:two-component system, OmpR family, response regulator ChvI
MPTVALVAYDHNVLASASSALKAEGYCIAAYTDTASALSAQTVTPDLAIFDIKMPRIDGPEALRVFRAKSEVPVIFLTSSKEVVDEVFALQLGADDFIRKPFSQRLLVERVRAVLRRAVPKKPAVSKEDSILECGPLRMDLERHTCTWKNHRVRITASEFLILHALATRPGVAKSRNALLQVAYDNPLDVDERSIDTHIKRLRKKLLASDSRFDMIESLYGLGYRFKEG